jgi:hypothetical protein
MPESFPTARGTAIQQRLIPTAQSKMISGIGAGQAEQSTGN